MAFVHLHNHSEYSLLDGASRIKHMVEKAKNSGMPAVALTDHGNMFGALEFYKTAKSNGIKPILGFEGYISPTTLDDKQTKGNYHITLLAKNKKGYENIMYLCSMAFLKGFYYKPRIDKNLLREHSEGIIAGSACLHGEVQLRLLDNDFEGAKKVVQEYKEIFGKENFFLEIMRHGLEDQQRIDKEIIRLGLETDTPIVATNDCHYLNKEDAIAQDALLCVQTNKHLDDQDRMKMGSQEFYFKTEEEMLEVFKDNPEFVHNSKVIADMCNVELELGKLAPPHYRTPDGSDEKEYLRRLAYKGLEEKTAGFDNGKKELYKKRLEHELAIIEQMGFSGYFLIVWDFVNYAKRNGIPVGPGRGSAAGSLVSYSIGITDIDPIKYNLLFERFLNPERVTMPDIDVDFCAERRDEVIHYVREKYGEYNVAQVITFGTMGAKAVVRDVARVMGFPYKEADRIAKMIPNGEDLDGAIKSNTQLKQEIEKDDNVKKLFEISKTLEGVKRHASIHAAGVVISTEPIYKSCPLYKAPGEDTIAVQFSKDFLEDIGLIKFDFLGLKNLTVIDTTVKLIGNGFDISKIPLDDKETYKLLQKGDTLGVFQLESSGMQRLIMDLKPTVFEDLIALVALYRPGPLGSGMVQDFIDRKHGKKPIEYPLPELEGILKDTYGIILYQEQVMQIASKLAGYSLGEADILRRAMGKKKKEVMDQQRGIFVKRAVERGVSKEKAEEIFDLMAKFAEYGFNKSHSAAYAYIAYQTAYLKAHYPAYFMSALLTSEKNNTDNIAKYIEECNRMKITVLPPDINDSFHDFAVAEKDGKKVIRFGFSAIKNVGDAAIENIIEIRKESKFESIFDFLKRTDTRKVNKKVLESLIKSGCFDSLHQNRATLLASVDVLLDWVSTNAKKANKKMVALFGSTKQEEAYPELIDVEELTQEKILEYERELLGFFVSSNPLSKYENMVNAVITADSETASTVFDKEVVMAGIPVAIRKMKTKRKESMAIVKFMDLKGTFEATVFPKLYEKYGKLFDESKLLIIIGNIDPTTEKVNLIVKDIIEYSKLSNYIDGVEVFLSEKDIGSIEKIKTILQRNKGDKPLFIRFKDKNALYTVHTYMKIAATATLLETLKKHNIRVRLAFKKEGY
ncbi:DNA polymerase III subunit alpha [Hippea maritima]|uniref:DNA polymerase III subunit alpha n=1 Tax=Hippea maritima (strain ATCC 700847 / DSM 10411 / MH2) TaxID=760142 RepID=F2LY35_HIPMA|nr:DNA polymerase III subunit alpha [Hippea maritima]AEA34358.1 DNA polymerase III, alpha subunit [Hippea maritima DSM 10411]